MAVTPSDAAPAVDAFELSGWIVLGCLASAGARAVLRCRRADDDGARFILKLLRPGATEAAKLRFEREAELLRRLRHPNLVPLVEAGQSPEGARYLILPELPGRPLSPGQLPPSGLLEVGRQIADVLATLHAAGVAHRDLKPENVLVDDLGQAALIDLGVAWVQGGARLTAAGQIPGTPWTLAPERLEGGDADPRPGDIYSLGLMLWQLWSGAPALQAMTPADLLAARRRGPLPALADAPEALSALLQAMTAPSPEARPSAAAVAEALSRLRGLVDDADRPGLLQTLDGSDAPPAAPQEPTQQLGRYVLQGELGRGGMGVVYRAWDPELQRQVALKTTSPGRRAERRFQREVRVVQDLDHPAIVRVLDVGEVDGTPYYAMELIEGPTLRALLTERGPLPPVEACACAAALAEGLTYAHARGVVHRDIKPENVLMEQGRLPRLLDFGLARRLDLESLAMTKTGELLGTPLYMAPEQVRGEEADVRADVYSLGAVLYEMLCGLPPHPPDHPARLLHDILHVDPAPLSSRRPGLPPALETVCLRALRRAPEERYPSMAAFAEDLRRWQQGEGLARDPLPRWGARRRQAARRAGLLLVGGLALLGLRLGVGHVQDAARERRAASLLANLEAEVAGALSKAQPGAADEAFASFVELDEVQGTAALSRGWLQHAGRLRAKGERDSQLSALASAYETAIDEDGVVASLLATADALRDAGRWSSVAAVARLLEARAPRAAGRPEVAALLAEARTLRRDLQRPAGEIAPLLEGLRRAHPSPHAAEDVRALDVDADGRAELLLGHAGEVWTLHTTDTLDLPELDGPYAFKEDSVRPIQGGQVYIKDGERVVVRFTRQGRGDTRPWPLPSDDVAALDLDGDGAPEWVAVGQGGAVLAVDPGSLSARALRPPSTGSTLNNVEAIDLDEDGEAELVVTAGEWNAFDVRVLARDPEGPYPFRLRARSKLGYLRDAVSVRGGPRPRVALNKADVWGSRVVFPPESPRGAAPGLYTLAWDGEALDVAPLLLGDLACEELYSGDIDGDGRDDLAAECAEGALLFRQLPDGGFARAALLGVAIRALVDVDGDGDAEVLATLAEDERLWILGAGEQTLPAVEPSAPSPSASDPAIQRAEELAELGLVEQAVTQLRRLAVVQPALRGEALLRAARLSFRLARWGEAEQLYLGASEAWPAGSERTQALEGAAWSAERALRLADARAHLSALAQEPLSEEGAARVAATERRLAALSGGAAPWTMELEGALDPRVQVGLPWGVRREAQGGLRLSASEDALLLSLPVERVGEALRIEASLELERLEWAAGLSLNLETESGELLLGARLDARGGGQYVFPRLRCPSDGDMAAIRDARPLDGAVLPLELRVLAAEGRQSCQVEGDVTQEERALAPVALPDGPLRLTLRAHSIGGGHTQVLARLRSLSAEGLVLLPPGESSPLAEARRLLADRQPQAALAAIEAATPRDRAWLAHRFAALEDAGRVQEAEDALQQLLTGLSLSERADLLRLNPDRWAPWFAVKQPGEWIPLFFAAYQFALRQHPDDPSLRSLLRRHLAALDVRRAPDEARLALLVARGEAFLPDEPGRARGDLLRAVSLGEALLVERPSEYVREQLVRALIRLAGMSAAAGGAEEAFVYLQRGLDLSTAPELTADIYAVQEALRPLHTEAAWARVLEARRAL